jgi:hypothetical protein
VLRAAERRVSEDAHERLERRSEEVLTTRSEEVGEEEERAPADLAARGMLRIEWDCGDAVGRRSVVLAESGALRHLAGVLESVRENKAALDRIHAAQESQDALLQEVQRDPPPALSAPSLILTDASLLALRSALPIRFRIAMEWALLFSTAVDGISLSTFFRKTGWRSPSLLLVKDDRRAVFGAYCSAPWFAPRPRAARAAARQVLTRPRARAAGLQGDTLLLLWHRRVLRVPVGRARRAAQRRRPPRLPLVARQRLLPARAQGTGHICGRGRRQRAAPRRRLPARYALQAGPWSMEPFITPLPRPVLAPQPPQARASGRAACDGAAAARLVWALRDVPLAAAGVRQGLLRALRGGLGFSDLAAAAAPRGPATHPRRRSTAGVPRRSCRASPSDGRERAQPAAARARVHRGAIHARMDACMYVHSRQRPGALLPPRAAAGRGAHAERSTRRDRQPPSR